MALREVGKDGLPQFEDAALPLLQLQVLFVELANGVAVQIITYQDNDEWGLCSNEADPHFQADAGGIFRHRELRELPRGKVADVNIGLNERDNISRVELLLVGGERVLLVAGEVYEETDGSLRVVRD